MARTWGGLGPNLCLLIISCGCEGALFSADVFETIFEIDISNWKIYSIPYNNSHQWPGLWTLMWPRSEPTAAHYLWSWELSLSRCLIIRNSAGYLTDSWQLGYWAESWQLTAGLLGWQLTADSWATGLTADSWAGVWQVLSKEHMVRNTPVCILPGKDPNWHLYWQNIGHYQRGEGMLKIQILIYFLETDFIYLFISVGSDSCVRVS